MSVIEPLFALIGMFVLADVLLGIAVHSRFFRGEGTRPEDDST